MSVIYIVLPMALVFAGLAVWAFIWAVRQGQLDDLETPAARILLDEDGAPRKRAEGAADETPSHDRAESAEKATPGAHET